EPEESRGNQAERLSPRILLDLGRARVIDRPGIVVAVDGVGVEHVVDVRTDGHALVPEPDVLGELEVEQRHALAVEIAGVEQVDRRRGHVVARSKASRPARPERRGQAWRRTARTQEGYVLAAVGQVRT